MSLLRPSRRDLLKMTAAAPAFALSSPVMARTSPPDSGQAAGYFRFKVGEAQLTVVSDGYFTGSARRLGKNAEEEEVLEFLEQHYLDSTTHYAHMNHVVIELGDAKVIVDVGGGTRFFDTAGRMLSNLEAAGINYDDITHVVLTHAHPDHVWGIRDDFDEAIFPDATYFIGSAEYDWWMKPDRVNEVAAPLQQVVLGAVNSLTVAEPQMEHVQDGHEVAPGIRMIDTPGHTPGHMSVMVESGDESLMIFGDSVSHAYVSFERPGWVGNFDMDGDLTVSTRRRLLDQTSADRMAVLGFHFPFPGVGYVMPSGDAYRFIPALWQWDDA